MQHFTIRPPRAEAAAASAVSAAALAKAAGRGRARNYAVVIGLEKQPAEEEKLASDRREEEAQSTTVK